MAESSTVAASLVAAYCEGRGHPCPVPEFVFHDSRAWRFDLAFPASKIAVEFHGGTFTGGRHTRGRGFEGDREKMNEAQLLGWIVLETTYRQVEKGFVYAWIDRAFAWRANAR